MQYNVFNPYEGFKSIFNHVMNHHTIITTEDGDVTYESDTVIVRIKKPLSDAKKLIDVYCMGPGAVKDYIAQFNDGVNTDGFEYTYYERLQDFNGENQLKKIVDNLKSSKFTRRGVICSDADASLWNPITDSKSSEPPCFNWMQALIRNNALNFKVLFRSHDILKGWPANVLAIAEMQRRMSEELNVDVGYLEVISSIPHIYIKSDSDLVKITERKLNSVKL